MRQVKTNTMRQTERLINRLGLDCNFDGSFRSRDGKHWGYKGSNGWGCVFYFESEEWTRDQDFWIEIDGCYQPVE